eukprot:m.245153 g.245153  ORF g.245153 m.245153 type:complete len:187 (-) comp26394_c1_seq2:673-1233(-)
MACRRVDRHALPAQPRPTAPPPAAPKVERGKYERTPGAPRDAKWEDFCSKEACTCDLLHRSDMNTAEMIRGVTVGEELVDLLQECGGPMHIVKTKVLHLGSRKTVLACPKGHKETRVNQAVLPEYKPPVETVRRGLLSPSSEPGTLSRSSLRVRTNTPCSTSPKRMPSSFERWEGASGTGSPRAPR